MFNMDFTAIERLKILYGEDVVNARTIVNMLRTRWSKDPHTLGSYSFPANGKYSYYS